MSRWFRPAGHALIVGGCVTAVATGQLVVSAATAADAQDAVFERPHLMGQEVSPVFEGWYRDSGDLFLSFGYVNLNYQEAITIPVGPNNRIEPAGIDQGQPTYFLPRRHTGVFAVKLMKEFEQKLLGDKGVVIWTLVANGKTVSIPANLGPNYNINALKEPTTGNTPPVIRFEPGGAAAQGPFGGRTERRAVVGQPLALDVYVTDDGVTKPHETQRKGLVALTWSKYRGEGAVKFENPTPPANGIAVGQQGHAHTLATFAEPGSYTLLIDAIDQSSRDFQCCWSNAYVDVTVTSADATNR